MVEIVILFLQFVNALTKLVNSEKLICHGFLVFIIIKHADGLAYNSFIAAIKLLKNYIFG